MAAAAAARGWGTTTTSTTATGGGRYADHDLEEEEEADDVPLLSNHRNSGSTPPHLGAGGAGAGGAGTATTSSSRPTWAGGHTRRGREARTQSGSVLAPKQQQERGDNTSLRPRSSSSTSKETARSAAHHATDEREAGTIEYLFTGKLTLFPLAILFLGIGAGVLLRYGDKPYLGGYFQSVEMYYGIAGLALAILALGFFFALMLCIVLKISFTFSPDTLLIKKHGVFRSAKLEFVIERTSLHYFRTHFSEEEAWLQLVVKEGNQFYQIFSWKGKGSQKDRFLKLFISLQRELIKWQQRSVRYRVLGRPREVASTEIVSKKEVNVISPFTHRLSLLLNGVGDSSTRPGAPLCIEDIAPISYDRFFRHFSHTKAVHRSGAGPPRL